MTVHILYDNQTVRSRLESGWGFSCLIDGRILFDTGEAGPSLLHNFQEMGISPTDIEAIVLSHSHWDHTGGVHALREILPDVPLYLPQGAQEIYPEKEDLSGANVKVCAGPVEVGPVLTSGTFVTEYKGEMMPEHGVLVRTGKGTSLITGCAHPGILLMADEIGKRYPEDEFYSILGGFHLMNLEADKIRETFRKLKSVGFKRIIATHCSGEIARNLGDYRTGVGDILAL